MLRFTAFIYLICLCCLTGCKTVTVRGENESTQEVKDAIGLVAEALRGQSMSDEEVDVFVDQLRKDEQAQSAVQSIADSMSPDNVRVKYCPVDGARFSPELLQCPQHHVDLIFVE